MKTITQDEFIDLVSSAYAVVVNYEYLQYVSFDDEFGVFIADRELEDITYLERLYDDIELDEENNALTFIVDDERMTLQLLEIKKLA